MASQVCEDVVNGFLVKPRDEGALVNGIVSFMDLSVEERRSLGRKSREMAGSRFNVNDVIRCYDKIIGRISY